MQSRRTDVTFVSKFSNTVVSGGCKCEQPLRRVLWQLHPLLLLYFCLLSFQRSVLMLPLNID